MSPELRRAVTQQIKDDQSKHPSPGLPKLEFAKDGHLKSSAEKLPDGPDPHALIGETDGERLAEYDPYTADLKSVDVWWTDGSYKQTDYEYDPRSGSLVKSDTRYSDGIELHRDYDAFGRPKSGVQKDPNGQIGYYERL